MIHRTDGRIWQINGSSFFSVWANLSKIGSRTKTPILISKPTGVNKLACTEEIVFADRPADGWIRNPGVFEDFIESRKFNCLECSR